MTKTNPWAVDNKTTNSGDCENCDLDPITSFEDNFDNLTHVDNNKLPDSVEYLEALERRLNRIRSNPNILSELSERREACMRHLLNDTAALQTDFDLQLEESTGRESEFVRHIIPEQPLTVGEALHLINYDQLQQEQCQQEDNQCLDETASR